MCTCTHVDAAKHLYKQSLTGLQCILTCNLEIFCVGGVVCITDAATTQLPLKLCVSKTAMPCGCKAFLLRSTTPCVHCRVTQVIRLNPVAGVNVVNLQLSLSDVSKDKTCQKAYFSRTAADADLSQGGTSYR